MADEMPTLSNGMRWTSAPRKKIKIRVREWTPTPDPPPITCRVCGTDQPAWTFSFGLKVCLHCKADPGSMRHGVGNLGWDDASMADRHCMGAAMGIIRRLEREHGPT